MGGRPKFAQNRGWYKRASKAARYLNRRVWYDPGSKFEYEADPNPAKDTWHEIDWRQGLYREIDPDTGQPVHGSEGKWRPLN